MEKLQNITLKHYIIGGQKCIGILFYPHKPNRYYEIERPMKEHKLPKVISKEEALAIIDHTSNIKHRCIVSLLYSAGLRRSELINLKITDIDSKRMAIRLDATKDNKDHYTLLSKRVLWVSMPLADDREKWAQLHSIVRIKSERQNKQTGQASTETRFYISSLKENAEQFNSKVRQHWAIENNLH